MPRMSPAEYSELLMRRKAFETPEEKRGKADGVPEDRVLKAVRHHALTNGYLFYHTHDSRGSDKGLPDVIATNGTRILFAELKSSTGKLTPEQNVWLKMLENTGLVDVRIWRPVDIHEEIPAYFGPSSELP